MFLLSQNSSTLFNSPSDLCVSAALDAVKERVAVPWSTAARPLAIPQLNVDTAVREQTTDEPSCPDNSSDDFAKSTPGSPSVPDPASFPRILRPHNFTKALKEITPTASESLGALVRKWNEEFGEGRKDRKRQQVWGKGIFGFIDKVNVEDDGRILPENSTGIRR